MLMQNFGVTNKEHYGMLCYFLEWSINQFPGKWYPILDLDLALLFHCLCKYWLSKAKAQGLYSLWWEWQKLVYIEKETVG